ncbi:MAG: carboxypeptidase-like regulatory domain-containing protein, partial [Acidobacterium ailaaui]|nr:carboxypeptidase-like regulatory domain-containing protein [Pseudacidobacterium ailaaui]
MIPNANVTVLNTSTGISSQQTTDSKGYYIFPQLAIGGPYSITISVSGFQTFKVAGLTLQLNDNREVNAVLRPGEVSQSVEVNAAAVQV